MSKFKVEIKKEAGEYTLLTTRNGYQWSGFSLKNVDQMRQIAQALLDKANEIENKNNE